MVDADLENVEKLGECDKEAAQQRSRPTVTLPLVTMLRVKRILRTCNECSVDLDCISAQCCTSTHVVWVHYVFIFGSSRSTT